MYIQNFIHENPSLVLKDIPEGLKPRVFELKFREISNSLWNIVIDDSEYEEEKRILRTRGLLLSEDTNKRRAALLRTLSYQPFLKSKKKF